MPTITTDYTKYQTALESKRAELRDLLPKFASGVGIEQTAEPMENTVNMVDRDQRARESNNATDTLNAVNKALAKLRLGEFGTCEECDEPMKPKRLDAVPWATACVPCQSARDEQSHVEVTA